MSVAIQRERFDQPFLGLYAFFLFAFIGSTSVIFYFIWQDSGNFILQISYIKAQFLMFCAFGWYAYVYATEQLSCAMVKRLYRLLWALQIVLLFIAFYICPTGA